MTNLNKTRSLSNQEYFKKNALDPSLTKHFRFVFNARSFDMKAGRVHIPKNHAEYIAGITREVIETGLNEKFNMLYNCLEMDKDMVKHLFSQVSKGVNKKLPMPIISTLDIEFEDDEITPEELDILNNNERDTIAVSILENDSDWVSVNEKNLIKHYGYPQQDAKNFSRNIREMLSGAKMPKKGVKPYLRTCLTQKIDGVRYYSWAIDLSIQGLLINDIISDEVINSISDIDVPNFSINKWKEIAKDYFESLDDTYDWSSLSIANQQRHIVNTIRHCSFGYDDSYQHYNDRLDSREAHNKVFYSVMKVIIERHPFLANECRRQIQNRIDNNLIDDTH